MVKHWKNYNCEQHVVYTKDDYLLCIHRIPSVKEHDKKAHRYEFKEEIEVIDNLDKFVQTETPKPLGYKGKPVVLLYHGFLMSSEVWVSNTDEYSNLPFVLAQRGYDVWLGNARGNKYSQYHLHLNLDDQQFWNFSMNEFVMRDLPDTIDVNHRLHNQINELTKPLIVYLGTNRSL